MRLDCVNFLDPMKDMEPYIAIATFAYQAIKVTWRYLLED